MFDFQSKRIVDSSMGSSEPPQVANLHSHPIVGQVHANVNGRNILYKPKSINITN